MEATDNEGQSVLAPRNVQTRLREQGLITKIKVKKPAMTKDHKKARLVWAKDTMGKEALGWSLVE
jgi:hypothetical protein